MTPFVTLDPVRPKARLAGPRRGINGPMTIATTNTIRWRVVRYAVAGAVLLNIVTLVWAFHASARTTVIAGIALTLVGAALGGIIGWSTAPSRWGRWWANGRTRRGSVRTPR
jgi:hypothetical protein